MARTTAQRRSLAGFIGAHGGLPSAPANTVAPSITGTAQVGETLTGATGTWTGRATPTLSRQWLRDGEPIEGATGATYDLTEDDEGAEITFSVTGRNWTSTVTAVSDPTGAVEPAEE